MLYCLRPQLGMRSASALLVLFLSLQAIGASAQVACGFSAGFQALRERIPEIVGDCLEDERLNPDSGNIEQRTTRGLLVWRTLDNRALFTDGTTTWILGPDGVASRPNDAPPFAWESVAAAGPSPSIPDQSRDPEPAPSPTPDSASERAYGLEMLARMDRAEAAIQAVLLQFRIAGGNIDLLKDPVWRNNMGAAIDAQRAAGEQLRAGPPPAPSLMDDDNKLKVAGRLLAEASDFVRSFFDNQDPKFLIQAEVWIGGARGIMQDVRPRLEAAARS